MNKPTFDKDSYPTKETLEAIKSWPGEDTRNLIEFIYSAWHWPDYAENEGAVLKLHTGGWSGNEDIVSALKENTVFWLLYWYSSKRGGHYEFRFRTLHPIPSGPA